MRFLGSIWFDMSLSSIWWGSEEGAINMTENPTGLIASFMFCVISTPTGNTVLAKDLLLSCGAFMTSGIHKHEKVSG